MTKAKYFNPLFALILLLFSCQNASEPKSNESQTATDQNLSKYLDDLEDFSGTILIAKNDQIIDQRAFGYANIEHKVDNQISTRFNIASITKMLTAVATLQLYDRKLVDLNTPIGAYLPSYSNKTVRDKVTIHQILTHTAGTTAFYDQKYLDSGKAQYQEIADYLPLFETDTLLFEPGEKYQYTGSGFVLLGLIIEELTGQSYYDYLAKEVFAPAGMRHTFALAVDTIAPNRASGYTSIFGDQDHLIKNEYHISKASPAGGYFSTVKDLFLFAKALRDHTLLEKETTTLMMTQKVKGFNTHLGYGIDIDQRVTPTIYGHSGGWFGVRTELMDFIDTGYTVVVLSNVDGGPDEGANKVIDDIKGMLAEKKTR